MKARLSIQLHIGFVVASLLFLAMMAAAWWSTWLYEQEVEVEQQPAMQATVALANAESALWQLRIGLPQFITGDEDARRRILEQESHWYRVLESGFETYARTHPAGEEAAGLAELRAEFVRYKEARPKFFELQLAGRVEEAASWSALTIGPYGAATVKAFERQIELQRRAVRQAAQRAREEIVKIRAVFTGLSGVLVTLLVLGYRTALRALRPIRELRTRVESTLAERFGQTVDASANGNEIAALVKSFQLMSDAFASRTGELEARQRESEALAELTSLLQAAESVEDAAVILPRLLGMLLAPHCGAVYLVKSSPNALESLGTFGTACACAPTVEPGECWALRRGQVYSAVDPARDIFCEHVSPQAASAGYVCLPMQARGESIGLLHVMYSAGFAAKENRGGQMQRVAEQLAVGLANLKLREALREQSIRDALTGLFNRRHLEESLERALARAKRDGGPLAVFMLDVDHFKHFNDTHGHEGGDAVLRSLGRVLRESTRAGDIACRFGGEEFTVVLHGATPEQARAWAERLLGRVRALTTKVGGQTLPGVTVSMGLACYPGGGEDVETLLQVADLALYKAKNTGRDRLMVAD